MGAPVIGDSDRVSVGDCVGWRVGDLVSLDVDVSGVCLDVGSDVVGSGVGSDADQTLVWKWLVLMLDENLDQTSSVWM